jgi:hypothetical protein
VIVPSVIFWSSGLIKEAFATIGLGLAFQQLYRFYRGRFSLVGISAAAAGLLLVATIKGYLLIPLGTAAGASMLFARARSMVAGPGSSLARRVVVLATSLIVVLGNVVDTTGQLQGAGEQVTGGSSYSLVTERSLSGQIAALPLVLGTALFRPVLFEARNAQMAANGLEMAFFTVLTLRALRQGRRGYRLIRDQPVLLFCGVFSIIMAIGVGLVSTNLGTLSRYRMPMMPFLWVLVTAIASTSPVAAARAIAGGRSKPAPGPRPPLQPSTALPLREGSH